ncbi:hypothetical protein D3C81_2327270 [compost metagenome]
MSVYRLFLGEGKHVSGVQTGSFDDRSKGRVLGGNDGGRLVNDNHGGTAAGATAQLNQVL